MFGSWNHEGARFRNGTIFDTTGGFSVTAATSIALAQDWKVLLAESLMYSPDNTNLHQQSLRWNMSGSDVLAASRR